MKSPKVFLLFKRMSDIILSVICIAILFPVILIAVILIAFDGVGGSIVIGSPRRVGKNEELFNMYKFRTMIHGAHKALQNNSNLKSLKKKQNQTGKLGINEDVRITSAGKFLRKWDIDEIPQLVNVLKGEMSLVGPRPYLKEEFDLCREKYPEVEKLINKLLTVRPGITGKWQVSGRNDIMLAERIKMDAEYVENNGFLDDLVIFIKTPYIVISRKGAK